MSLWGNSDNVTSAGKVSLDYDTKIVTGSASPTTAFGAVGSAKTGDVIRFGIRGAAGAGTTYFGDAVIVGITSARQLTIGSTEGLSGAAIGSTDFYISELPSYTVNDASYSKVSANSGYDKIVYGISTSTSITYDGLTTEYRTGGSGWVGVTTYVDCDGNFRVKSEILVAMGGDAGVTTGANGIAYPTNKG